MIKDAEKIQTLLHEMVETPSVVRITNKDIKLFREGLIASDCRCSASDPQAFVKVIEQLEKDTKEGPATFDAIWSSSLTDSTSKGKPDIEAVDLMTRLSNLCGGVLIQ